MPKLTLKGMTVERGARYVWDQLVRADIAYIRRHADPFSALHDLYDANMMLPFSLETNLSQDDLTYYNAVMERLNQIIRQEGSGVIRRECECGNMKFYASQRVYMTIVVDDLGQFVENSGAGGAPDIYESDDPYGPYTCTVCQKNYDNWESIPVKKEEPPPIIKQVPPYRVE